jgi:deoxyribodipyrimidine photo-lyase
MKKIVIHWFRRDLRLYDNHALHEALQSGLPVLAIFIFDQHILQTLHAQDPRISFIYQELCKINTSLKERASSLSCFKGDAQEILKQVLNEYDVKAIYANEDYEPSAIHRDEAISSFLAEKNIALKLYKDQVIFAKDEICKQDALPYTMFTPYKNKWMSQLHEELLPNYHCETGRFLQYSKPLPLLEDLGFQASTKKVIDYDLGHLEQYESTRDVPAKNTTSYLSPHLRFGTVSIRKIVRTVLPHTSFLNELIWREFFMQILFHFPHVVNANFRSKYNLISWRNNTKEFDAWKQGKTGYPIVDAGMRQLNESGYMHNRVRMITAGFLCKHLLIDWRWGEAYFAEKLLDYELSSNNGNWQWAAGTGCDAAPYFRVFNPITQQEKFDADRTYCRKWIPEIDTNTYPHPIVDHSMARTRAIETYKNALSQEE